MSPALKERLRSDLNAARRERDKHRTLLLTTTLTSKVLPQYAKVRTSIDSINRLFRQNMSGIRVVKAFGKTEFEQQQFDGAVSDAYDATVRAESTMMLLSPLVLLFVNVLVLAILWRGGVRAESGLIQIGVGEDEHRVLATHLSDRRPQAAPRRRDCTALLIDARSHGAGAGECDHVDKRARHQRRADGLTSPR